MYSTMSIAKVHYEFGDRMQNISIASGFSLATWEEHVYWQEQYKTIASV
jgi:hypothetical protein